MSFLAIVEAFVAFQAKNIKFNQKSVLFKQATNNSNTRVIDFQLRKLRRSWSKQKKVTFVNPSGINLSSAPSCSGRPGEWQKKNWPLKFQRESPNLRPVIGGQGAGCT